MTRKEFEVLVKKALKNLPKEFKNKLQNVEIVIDDEQKHGRGRKGQILGLYQGVPLKERTHDYQMVMPDKITLFKENIELACQEGGLDIEQEVRHVIQHEIAHHFGISDKRLRDLGVY